MRRLVTGPARYFRELTAAIAAGWDRFFFTPADPTPLGLIRAITGLLLLRSLWVLGYDLPGFLGSHSWTDPLAVREWMAQQAPASWSFWLLVPDRLLTPVWAVCLVVLALFTVGLFSRTTAVLSWVIAVSTARRAPTILYGFDHVVTTWTFYLAVCGASGQAVSLDRFLARWKTARAAMARRPSGGATAVMPSGVPAASVSARIGLRLLQLHLCLIYGMAAISKFQGTAWWTGMAIWGVLAAAEFRRFDLTWMAAYPLALNFLTHCGLFLELVYPALIWVPVLRPLVLAAMIGLHVGVDLALGLTEFGLAMLAGNLAFVSGPWLRSLVAGKDHSRPAGRVLYDGACPRCRRSIALVTAADPAAVVEPIDLNRVDVASIHPALTPEGCQRSMHLVRADGRVSAGFDAMATLARWLPLFWPVGLLAWVPGVAVVGRRTYNALAASRPRDVPCTDETCELPSAAGRPRR